MRCGDVVRENPILHYEDNSVLYVNLTRILNQNVSLYKGADCNLVNWLLKSN